MKIVLTTTTLVAAFLAIGLLGINNNSNNIDNIFAQEGAITPEGVNNTMSMGNDTGMMGMDDDSMKTKLNGTINVESTIAEAFKSKVTTDIIGAIQAAQTSVGANSFVKEAELTDAHGYLVYKITAVDENMKKYKVIVDPGNGQVLMKKEVTGYEYDDKHDKYDKMKYGHGDKRYDKYGEGSDHDYDQKNMMMKEKNY